MYSSSRSDYETGAWNLMTIMSTKDGGMSSRKFIVVVLAMGLITLGALIAIKFTIFAGLYSIFIGGILGAAGLYFGGNITGKVLAGKVNASVEIESIKQGNPRTVITPADNPTEETVGNQNGE